MEFRIKKSPADREFDRRGARLPALILKAVLIVAGFVLLASCSSKPTEMRALVPAETLIYLETNDVGRLLKSLQDNKPFAAAMKSRTDFSVLNGMQMAIAVSGFEASEDKLTNENSVLNFKPRFVAVADTHAWNRSTLSFVEETLGNFINETYGGSVQLTREVQGEGERFVWVGADGRRAFAFVRGSIVFFSNDETALGKALAVGRGEADPLTGNASTARLKLDDATVAGGHVSPDGIAQLSNLAGVSTALDATDDEDGQSFIARVLPEIVRNSISEITWTASKSESGFEDRFSFVLKPETSAALKETVRATPNAPALAEFVPADPYTATRYNLENPQIAWRAVLLSAGRATDQTSGNIIVAFADGFFEPYGVAVGEDFLGAVGNEIWTVSLDSEGEQSAAIVTARDAEKLKRSITEINWNSSPEVKSGAEIRRSADGELAAALIDGRFLIGDPETVMKCLDARTSGQNFQKSPAFARIAASNAPAITFGREATDRTVGLLGVKNDENLQFLTNYLTETRFTDRGVERRTTSPFGLAGRILEQFDDR